MLLHLSGSTHFLLLQLSYTLPRRSIKFIVVGVGSLAVGDLLDLAVGRFDAHAMVLAGFDVWGLLGMLGIVMRRMCHTLDHGSGRGNAKGSHGQDNSDDGGELHIDGDLLFSGRKG